MILMHCCLIVKKQSVVRFVLQQNKSDISGLVKNGSNLSKRPKWKPGHSLRFCNIDEYKLELIQTDLHKMSNNINNLDNNCTDCITDSICDLLIESAKQIGCFHAMTHSNISIKSRNNKNLGSINLVGISSKYVLCCKVKPKQYSLRCK